jgi:hypothetical protein
LDPARASGGRGQQSGISMTRERLIHLCWALGGLTVMAVALGPSVNMFVVAMMGDAITVDYPWLLESGRAVIDLGGLPGTDIFSWTHAQEEWVQYQWLFEVALVQAEQLLGIDWMVRLFMLLVFVIYVLAPLFVGVPGRVSYILTVTVGSLALLISTVNISIRPGLVTTLFLLIQFVTLAKMRRGELRRAGFAVIGVMYLLWGNIHMGVILGIISLLLMLAGDFLEGRGWRRFEPADPQVEGAPLAPRLYFALIGLGFLASLLNPYGLHIYERIIDVSAQTSHTANVDELRSLDMQWLQGKLLLLLLGGFMVTLTFSRRALSAQEIMHIALFTAMGMFAARLVLWPVLFYALILPKALHHAWTDMTLRHPRLKLMFGPAEEFRTMFVALVVLFGVVMTLGIPHYRAKLELGICEESMPGLEKIAGLRRPQDRMFNDPTSGSCLLLIDPKAKLFIDPRFDFYGGDFLAEAASVMRMEREWREVLDRWEVDSVVMRREWPIANALDAAEDYEKLFDDGNVAFYRKRLNGD